MRILVLDDDPHRHSYFDKQFGHFEVVHVWSYKQFFDTIMNQSAFDYVFLDHDLGDSGERFMQKKGKGTYIEKSITRYCIPGQVDGRDVVEDMIDNLPPELKPTQCIVHSWNPQGADEMMAMLKDADYNAFRWVFNPKEKIQLK